jgi:copper(I)-binding protein
MSHFIKSAALGLFLATACLSGAQAAGGSIKVVGPWIRPNPPGAPTAAGYLTVVNTGRSPDRLLGGSSPQVGKVEIHQMSMQGAIMRMRALSGGVAISPGATVKLEPGSYHLMLVGPKRAFRAGERVPITLNFQHAGAVKTEFAVQMAPPAQAGPSAPHAKMQHMEMH